MLFFVLSLDSGRFEGFAGDFIRCWAPLSCLQRKQISDQMAYFFNERNVESMTISFKVDYTISFIYNCYQNGYLQDAGIREETLEGNKPCFSPLSWPWDLDFSSNFYFLTGFFHIQWTLTWMTWTLMCVRDFSHACTRGGPQFIVSSEEHLWGLHGIYLSLGKFQARCWA